MRTRRARELNGTGERDINTKAGQLGKAYNHMR